MCIQNFASLPSEVLVLPQAESENAYFSTTQQSCSYAILRNIPLISQCLPGVGMGEQEVFSGEGCSRWSGLFSSLGLHCLSRTPYSPVGTQTQLLLGASLHSLACAPDDLVGLIILCVPSSFQALPLLFLSASTFFPPSSCRILFCILVYSFIFLHYSVSFSSFFNFCKVQGLLPTLGC